MGPHRQEWLRHLSCTPALHSYGYSKTRILRALLLRHTSGVSAKCDCVPASHVSVSRSELESEE